MASPRPHSITRKSFEYSTSTLFSFKQSIIAALALSVGLANALTGKATWYTPNSGVGACGAPMQNPDHIVALSSNQYAGGAHYWKHTACTGKFVNATIGDLCPGCGPNGIDLSLSAFEKLAPLDDGRIQVAWNYE